MGSKWRNPFGLLDKNKLSRRHVCQGSLQFFGTTEEIRRD